MAQERECRSRAPFPSTSWTLIRRARELTGADQVAALDELLRQYWRPVYSFFRSKGKTPQTAEDLAQEFLAKLVEDKKLDAVKSPTLRFRNWLLVCARNFMLSRDRKEGARRRRPVGGVASLAKLGTQDGTPFEPQADQSPDQAFLDAWRRSVLESSTQLVQEECLAKNRMVDWHVFVDYYLAEGDTTPTWQELADRYRLPTWKHAARKADWVKQRLATAIREVIAQYVPAESDLDDEIRDLLQ